MDGEPFERSCPRHARKFERLVDQTNEFGTDGLARHCDRGPDDDEFAREWKRLVLDLKDGENERNHDTRAGGGQAEPDRRLEGEDQRLLKQNQRL